MKLKEYAKHLSDLAEQYPDVEVYTSKDSEGNGYNRVVYMPDCDYFVEELKYYVEDVVHADDREEQDEMLDEWADAEGYHRICVL